MATALMNSMNNLSIHGNHNQSNHVHNSNGTNNNMIGGNNNNSNNNGKSSLFVGDLSIFCSEQDLEKAFSPFGTLLEIKIMRSEETSRNLSYGFIKFAAPNSAKMAMDQLNGVMLCGRQMR